MRKEFFKKIRLILGKGEIKIEGLLNVLCSSSKLAIPGKIAFLLFVEAGESTPKSLYLVGGN